MKPSEKGTLLTVIVSTHPKKQTQKPISDSQIDDYFNSAVRAASDPEKYAPTFKLSVPLDKDGKPAVEVFDDTEKPSTWEKFEEGIKDGEFCCIFKTPAVYFLPK